MKAAIALSTIVLLAGCISPSETPEKLVARIGADVIVKDAFQTHLSFVATHNAKGIPVDYHARIPSDVWVGTIHNLAPAYVYYAGSGINMVVVLKSGHNTEEGLYIVPMYSSGLALSKNGFSLSAAPFERGNIYTFKRDLKQKVDDTGAKRAEASP